MASPGTFSAATSRVLLQRSLSKGVPSSFVRHSRYRHGTIRRIARRRQPAPPPRPMVFRSVFVGLLLLALPLLARA